MKWFAIILEFQDTQHLGAAFDQAEPNISEIKASPFRVLR